MRLSFILDWSTPDPQPDKMRRSNCISRLSEWYRNHYKPEKYLLIDNEAQKICLSVEALRIESEDILTLEPCKPHKIYAQKYFILRMAELDRAYKDTMSNHRNRILKICHYWWNIYLAAKINEAPGCGEGLCDLKMAVVKDCLDRVSSHDVYWDIRTLSMYSHPELFFTEFSTHVGLSDFLISAQALQDADLEDISLHLAELTLDSSHVTLGRLCMLKKGLRDVYGDPNQWPFRPGPNTNTETWCRFTRPLILMFCLHIQKLPVECASNQHLSIPKEQIRSGVKICVESCVAVIPAVLTYDRFPAGNRMQW